MPAAIASKITPAMSIFRFDSSTGSSKPGIVYSIISLSLSVVAVSSSDTDEDFSLEVVFFSFAVFEEVFVFEDASVLPSEELFSGAALVEILSGSIFSLLRLFPSESYADSTASRVPL